MLKKILFIIAIPLFLGLSNSYGAINTGKDIISESKLFNGVSKKVSSNEIYYVWVLMDNGCYYLYRVEVVDDILEFWTPMGPLNYAGTTVNCMFQKEIDSLC